MHPEDTELKLPETTMEMSFLWEVCADSHLERTLPSWCQRCTLVAVLIHFLVILCKSIVCPWPLGPSSWELQQHLTHFPTPAQGRSMHSFPKGMVSSTAAPTCLAKARKVTSLNRPGTSSAYCHCQRSSWVCFWNIDGESSGQDGDRRDLQHQGAPSLNGLRLRAALG